MTFFSTSRHRRPKMRLYNEIINGLLRLGWWNILLLSPFPNAVPSSGRDRAGLLGSDFAFARLAANFPSDLT